MRTAVILMLAAPALAALPAQATPAFSWMYIAESHSLIGSTGEEEGDTDFRATCKAGGKAELGIGAAQGVGTGGGEAVTVTLANADGTLTVHIAGVSKQSPNFQMTAAVELVAAADKTHAVFTLLAAPGPIKVSGPLSPQWPATGRAAATKAFISACFGR